MLPNQFSISLLRAPRRHAVPFSPPSWVSLHSQATEVEALAAYCPSHLVGQRNSVVGVQSCPGCPLGSLHLN